MKEKLIRFMYGRNGVDSFGQFCASAGLFLYLLHMITRIGILYYFALIFVFYYLFRALSKNRYKRQQENAWFLAKTYRIRTWFRNQKGIAAQSKTHRIFACPSCKQKIRVPKGKGKIEITCPKCRNTFIKRT